MRVLVGGICQETNTFSKQTVVYNDFVQFRGDALLKELAQTALFAEAGIKALPAVYASATPSAGLSKAEFQKFLDEFIELAEIRKPFDAIYLSLHGAMFVNGVGSGEARLVECLREKYGDDMPIFASFDFHGNMTPALTSRLNFITDYRTAPHEDVLETGQRAVRALIRCLKEGKKPQAYMIKIPLMLPGEKVITAEHPCRDIIARLNGLIDGENVWDASWFCGFVWTDNAYMCMSVTISCMNLDAVKQMFLDAANDIWMQKDNFVYAVEAYEPSEAAKRAVENEAPYTFVSDTGDNITAGAAGDSALMLFQCVETGHKQTLVGGVTDEKAIAFLEGKALGEPVSFTLGGTIDPESFKMDIDGILLTYGNMAVEKNNCSVRFALVDFKGVHVLITNIRMAFTSPDHYAAAGISLDDYKVVVVKLGYLFPELAKAARRSILAITPGNAYQDIARISYRCVENRFYPKYQDISYAPRIV